MSSLGILIVILAVFMIINVDKLAWVFMGNLELNAMKPVVGVGGNTNSGHNLPKDESN